MIMAWNKSTLALELNVPNKTIHFSKINYLFTLITTKFFFKMTQKRKEFTCFVYSFLGFYLISNLLIDFITAIAHS